MTTDKPKGRFITKAEYARHRGVNKSQVTRAVKAGRITETRNGTIEWRKADLTWEDYRMDSLAFTGTANNTKAKPAVRATGMGSAALPGMDRPEAIDGPDDLDTEEIGKPPAKNTRAFEDYREKKAKADWAELRVREKRGQLLDRNDVIAVYGAVLGGIKTGVLAMPQRISLTATSTIHKWLKDHGLEVSEGALTILEKALQEIVASEAHYVLADLAKRIENIELEADTIAELKE